MPKKEKGKLPVKDILTLYDDCAKRYSESGIYSQFDEDERFYELGFAADMKLPAEFKDQGTVLPTARDLVDSCTDHTDIFNVRVFTNRKGDSKQSESQQNLLRKFGLGVLYRNNMEASISPIRVGAKHYWLHGLAVFKTVWDADRWIDKPEQNEGESGEAYAARIDTWRAESHDSIPIVIQSVHPRNIMLDPYLDGGSFVFETRDELVFDVKTKFPKWGNPLGRKVTDTVTHISWWTKEYRCELYDREPVKYVKHDYGFIPFVVLDTGLGNLSANNDLKKRYVGVLRYITKVLVSESRDYSIGDVILGKTAFPWGYLKGDNAESVTTIFQKFGEYNTLPAGVEIVDMSPKVPPDALLTWLSVASSYLASHAAPPSVRGMGEQNVRSGADRRLLIAEASTRYQYSNEALRMGVAKILSNCARIMKNVVPGNISVWARTPNDEFDIEIVKEEMKEPFNFYVEFAPVSEEDEYRRHDDLERLMKSGMVTKNWARKQMSNVDPQAMQDEEEFEKLLNDPMVQQVVGQYTVSVLMQELQKRSLAESATNPPPPMPMGAPGQTPAPGQPQQTPGRRVAAPIPNLAPPGSAEALQNQMANQRSQIPMNPGQGAGGGGNRR